VIDPQRIRTAAAALDLDVSEAQAQQLSDFAALLLRWNAVYNLTAIRDEDPVLSHHLLDCLAVVPQIDRISEGRAIRILDVGSGGGLPAVPLAIALPHVRVVSLDAVQKKCAFVQQAKGQLRLENLDVVHARAEAWRSPERFDVVVSRAFATLADFIRVSRHLLASHGIWAAMKGTLPEAELRELPHDVRVVGTVKLRVPLLDEQRHLILLAPAAAD